MVEIADVAAISDARERAKAAHALIDEYQSAIASLAQLRRDTFDELLASGMTQTDIATLLGVTRSRISQLMAAAGRRPERALLSPSDTVTIGVPVEVAPYPDGPERPVVHREDADFIERITRIAKDVGLRANVEYVGPGEFIDLNRDGLVITCGPRQSPWLEQALTADERYGFARDDAGWYLLDKTTGEKHHSPADSGEPADYAYLGALPRPDGTGSWLYAAGIHASGSRGAAKYLEDNLASLYQEVKNGIWSCLVRCTYDPESREILSADLLASIQRRGTINRPRRR